MDQFRNETHEHCYSTTNDKTTNKVTAVNKPWTHVLSVVLIHAELGGADPGRLLDQVLPLDDLPSLGDTGGDLEAHGHHRQK